MTSSQAILKYHHRNLTEPKLNNERLKPIKLALKNPAISSELTDFPKPKVYFPSTKVEKVHNPLAYIKNARKVYLNNLRVSDNATRFSASRSSKYLLSKKSSKTNSVICLHRQEDSISNITPDIIPSWLKDRQDFQEVSKLIVKKSFKVEEICTCLPW